MDILQDLRFEFQKFRILEILNFHPWHAYALYYSNDSLLSKALFIPAHRIRISEILPRDKKSYLAQAILPRLSREGYIYIGCIGTHAHSRQVTSLLCLRDVMISNCISSFSGTSRSLF